LLIQKWRPLSQRFTKSKTMTSHCHMAEVSA
jgi:hypothetical protein